MDLTTDQAQRFWAKVLKTPTCWLWQGGHSPTGYGRWSATWRGSAILAHRAAWFLTRGPIPAHLELDHLCRVRHCVRPEHLELVTHAENVRRSTNWAALNIHKTHCPQGHPYDETNTIRVQDGRARRCRTCKLATRGLTPAAARRIYERDGRTCRSCGATDRLSIDHIVPRSLGGTSDPANLQVLCVACNSRKGVSVSSPSEAGTCV